MNTRFSRAFAICALLAAVGCSGPTPDPQQEAAAPAGSAGGTVSSDLAASGPADIILSNGKVITVDEKFTMAQAVAIKGERVLAVGVRSTAKCKSL